MILPIAGMSNIRAVGQNWPARMLNLGLLMNFFFLNDTPDLLYVMDLNYNLRDVAYFLVKKNST